MRWSELLNLLVESKEPNRIDEKREEIAEWLPCVREMFGYDQNSKYHQYDLWLHCIHTVLGIEKSIDDDMVYLAALLHDIGKPVSRCKGKREDDPYSHYYGHPDMSEQIVRENVIPHLKEKGVEITAEEQNRLLYYVKYHDDRVSLRIKHLKRHLKIVDLNTFKKLMALQVADAKAHNIYPLIQQRIDICSEWYNSRAELFAEMEE